MVIWWKPPESIFTQNLTRNKLLRVLWPVAIGQTRHGQLYNAGLVEQERGGGEEEEGLGITRFKTAGLESHEWLASTSLHDLCNLGSIATALVTSLIK